MRLGESSAARPSGIPLTGRCNSGRPIQMPTAQTQGGALLRGYSGSSQLLSSHLARMTEGRGIGPRGFKNTVTRTGRSFRGPRDPSLA